MQMLLKITPLLELIRHSAATQMKRNFKTREEINGYFEGNLRKGKETADGSFREGGSTRRALQALRAEDHKWPGGKLYYIFDPSVKDDKKVRIRTVLQRLQAKLGTCVQFEEGKSSDNCYVLVQHTYAQSSSSDIGYNPFNKRVTAMKITDYMVSDAQIEHEFLHALGLAHTQQRWDRDQFVTVVKSGADYVNFGKKSRAEFSTYGLDYDFNSVMHDKFRQDNIRAKDPAQNEKFRLAGLRWYDGVSEGDIELVKRMYRSQCSAISPAPSYQAAAPRRSYYQPTTSPRTYYPPTMKRPYFLQKPTPSNYPQSQYNQYQKQIHSNRYPMSKAPQRAQQGWIAPQLAQQGWIGRLNNHVQNFVKNPFALLGLR